MIVEAMKGYRAADLPKDAVAGLVIAALSIPIAMGYAEVVGLPAIYGLWASIVAPLASGCSPARGGWSSAWIRPRPP
ncbi:MAG: SulP family inorganic anion transporter [Adlercreutzia equolifaciens]